MEEALVSQGYIYTCAACKELFLMAASMPGPHLSSSCHINTISCPLPGSGIQLVQQHGGEGPTKWHPDQQFR